MKNLILIVLCFSSVHPAWASKKLALSFDDSPRLDSPLFGAKKRADFILKVLKDKSVEEVIFFATPQDLNKNTLKILRKHGLNGHLIGNHTHQHHSLNKIDLKIFTEDIKIAHDYLRYITGFYPLFRFPFLHEGNTLKKRNGAFDFISNLGYQNGYVTIDNSEWYLEKRLKQAIQQGLSINYEKLGQLYVDSLLNCANFYYNLAGKYIDSKTKHVLLLHENEVAALFLPKLIDALRNDDWEIISPTEAYKDPINQVEPKTLRLNQGRVMAIAIDRGYKGPQQAPMEDKDILDRIIRENKIFR